MQQKLNQLKEESLQKINSLASEQEIVDFRNEIVGKTGSLTEILKGIKDLSVEEKQTIGKLSNDIKVTILEAFDKRLQEIKKLEIESKLSNEFLDVTIPSNMDNTVHIHPITRILNEVYNTFERMGFEIEDNTFNTPKGIKDLLSASKKSSFKSIIVNKIQNGEESFYQVEGIVVDKDLNLGNLKYLIKNIITDIFGKELEITFRPGYSEFLEPSVLIDFSCPYCNGTECTRCNNSGKIEFIFAGLIRSGLLSESGFDSNEFGGLAFSFSINNLAMIKYGINDSSLLSQYNIEFLKQF